MKYINNIMSAYNQLSEANEILTNEWKVGKTRYTKEELEKLESVWEKVDTMTAKIWTHIDNFQRISKIHEV